MFTIVCYTLLTFALADLESDHGPWNGAQTFNEENNFNIRWKVNEVENELTIMLSSTSTGWLGFGIGEDTSGSMLGADIVTLNDNGSGSIVVADRYVGWHAFPLTESMPYPVEDVSNDWTLLGGTISNDGMEAVIRRSLDTGDSQDRSIVKGMTRVIYAWGSSSSVGYHQNQRGASSINFFESFELEFNPPHDEVVEARMQNYSIPDQTTSYACQSIDLGAEYESKGVVAFDMIVDPDNTKYVHHMLFYQCTDDEYFELHKTPGFCGGENPGGSPLGVFCTRMVYGWAVGGGPMELPPKASFNGMRYVIVEIHYDNPVNGEGVRDGTGVLDTSGVRLYFEDAPREYVASSLSTGDITTSMPNLEPGVAETHLSATCSGGCTSRFNAELHVFASFLHMHSFGKQIWTSHYDENFNLKAITNRIDFWNFEFQQITKVNYTISPGDNLETHCVFDTSLRTEEVAFGADSLDEMCFDFLFYYTKNPEPIDIRSCGYVRFWDEQIYEISMCSDGLPFEDTDFVQEQNPIPLPDDVPQVGLYPQEVPFGKAAPTRSPTISDVPATDAPVDGGAAMHKLHGFIPSLLIVQYFFM